MHRRFMTVLCLLLLLAAGCNRYNGPAARKEHAQVYPAQLAEKSSQALSANTVLDLQDCIHLAMEHSLEIKSAEIKQRLARFDKNIAFCILSYNTEMIEEGNLMFRQPFK